MTDDRRVVLFIALIAAGSVLMVGCERDEYQATAVEVDEERPDDEAQPSDFDDARDRSDQFTMTVSGADIEVGNQAEVQLQLLPGPDLKINLEFPWVIEFEEVDALEYGATRLGSDAMDLQDERATIPVTITAGEPGNYEVMARADFSVCNDDRCDILRDEPLSFMVRAR